MSVSPTHKKARERHPDADSIENYVMGVRLDPVTRSALSEHFAKCAACRAACAETTVFVSAMREALVPEAVSSHV